MAENDNGFVGGYQVVQGVELPDIVAYPPYVTTAYFFLNILPIVIPTYLIVFFCELYRYCIIFVVLILPAITGNARGYGCQ